MPLDASFASLFDKSGFVDGSSGASVVANEMIAIPFLSEALCSNLIDIAEASQSFAVSGTDPSLVSNYLFDVCHQCFLSK